MMDCSHYRILVLSLILVLCSSGIASAKVMPQQPDEVQNYLIEISVISSGIFKQDSKLDWALSSEYLGFNNLGGDLGFEPEPPLNPAGEVQMYCSYAEDTSAMNGQISFDKVESADTRAKSGRDWNIENTRMITFTGYDAGSVLSTEDLDMTAVGTSIPLSFSSICPICDCPTDGCDCIPMFCNTIGVGSSIDLDTFSLTSSTNLRNVNKPGDPGFFPPIPSSDEPARLSFQTVVTGFAVDQPANGMISTHFDEKSLEGGTAFPGLPDPIEDLKIHEHREIIGKTTLFSYTVDYVSGIRVNS